MKDLYRMKTEYHFPLPRWENYSCHMVEPFRLYPRTHCFLFFLSRSLFSSPFFVSFSSLRRFRFYEKEHGLVISHVQTLLCFACQIQIDPTLSLPWLEVWERWWTLCGGAGHEIRCPVMTAMMMMMMVNSAGNFLSFL